MLARLGAWTGRLIAGLAFGLLVVGMAVGPIPALAQTRSATLSGVIANPKFTGTGTWTVNGIATTSTDGLLLQNTTAATVGVPTQFSPRLRLRGTWWNGSSSSVTDWWFQSGSTNGNGFLSVQAQTDGGAISEAMRMSTSGGAGFGISTGGSVTVNGAQAYVFNTRSAIWSTADGIVQFLNSASTGFTRAVFGTNDGTANGWSLLRSGTYIETWTGDGTSARTGIKTSGILNVGAFQSVNNIATAGSYGVPAILAAGSGAAISAAADTNRCTVTPAADGDFEVSDNILVTTAGSLAATATIGYTDEGNTARTQTIPFVLVAGTAIVTALAAANGTVPYNGIPVHIRAKSGVAINVSTTGTFTGSVYNHRCIIRALQ